ncbi:fucolectin-4-like [Protopterus annectens]|uniref:fucolectin-4-like n=1 Tax=Protopterus annectens TaxID=7888 RepID=UPI001CFB23C1|nr:fucolectin-4-like [Protopterus annectens]
MMKPIYHFSISLMLWAFGRNDGGEACSRFPEETNVALTGYATQSSDYPGTPAGPAINAIDGKRNSEYYTGKSCTHTNFQSSPWWRVDLQTSYLISAITVTARGDCCTSRLEGAEIHVGNSLKNNGIDNPLCAKITGITSAAPQTFCCNGMEGRYVTIVIPDKSEWLTLCEVEVYAVSSCKNEIKGTNIALKGYATQSSDYKVDPPGPPQNAIDGKKSTDYYTGKSCTHTDLESSPWWRVDLLQSYQISEVIVTGRGDCCASRLEGAEIRVGNSLKNNGINNAL